MDLYEFTEKLLSLFLIPFQSAFMESVFGSVFLFLIVVCPVILFLNLWRGFRR